MVRQVLGAPCEPGACWSGREGCLECVTCGAAGRASVGIHLGSVLHFPSTVVELPKGAFCR